MPAADHPTFDPDIPREPSFRNPGTVGMLLFIAALTMLFAASLLAYVMIRLARRDAMPAGQIHLPGLLWLSTLLVVGVSVALGLATRQIRNGLHRSYRKSLTAALALAAGFLTVQAPAMVNLLGQHATFRTSNVHLYGLIFFLILLHALHVVGGMVSLAIVTIKAHRGAYDRPAVAAVGAGPGEDAPEPVRLDYARGVSGHATDPGHDPIRHTTLYWHFLDAVWIVMFSTFLMLR
jgi:cytochrome c oxidase subunit 3